MDGQSHEERIASELLALLGTGRQSGRYPDLDFAEAYAVAARIRDLRQARGERPVGRKIGFTNTTIWERYGVTGPMWNFVYDSTVHDLADVPAFDLTGLPEPRIEPEIVLHLAEAPDPGMDERALLGCIDWIAHGFEIVQSVYPELDPHRPRVRRRLRPARRALHRRAPPGRRRPRPLGGSAPQLRHPPQQPRRPGRRRPRQPRPRRTAQRAALPDRRDRPLSQSTPRSAPARSSPPAP